MMSVVKDFLEVGVISGTHGLRGDLKVRPLPTGDLALPGARVVHLADAEGRLTPFRSLRCSPHKNCFLLRLEGLDSVEAVSPLVGSAVCMAIADLPKLTDAQYYWTDLEGLAVIDRTLGELGRVRGMFSTAAHDILEVDGEYGEILIPAIPPFLTGCDRDHGVLHVDLPDGLVPDSGDSA